MVHEVQARPLLSHYLLRRRQGIRPSDQNAQVLLFRLTLLPGEMSLSLPSLPESLDVYDGSLREGTPSKQREGLEHIIDI